MLEAAKVSYENEYKLDKITIVKSSFLDGEFNSSLHEGYLIIDMR
jgi:hypothetical protein